MSRSAQLGAMVYAQATAAEPKQVLAEIEELLQALGAAKSNLLTARVLVSDEALFADYDRAWDEWLQAERRPLRVWKLFDAPARLVDITVTGLRMRASPSRSPHVQGRPSQG
jgi:enamine deaminase RidA (YjgF/YER057c/UK114 family)